MWFPKTYTRELGTFQADLHRRRDRERTMAATAHANSHRRRDQERPATASHKRRHHLGPAADLHRGQQQRPAVSIGARHRRRAQPKISRRVQAKSSVMLLSRFFAQKQNTNTTTINNSKQILTCTYGSSFNERQEARPARGRIETQHRKHDNQYAAHLLLDVGRLLLPLLIDVHACYSHCYLACNAFESSTALFLTSHDRRMVSPIVTWHCAVAPVLD